MPHTAHFSADRTAARPASWRKFSADLRQVLGDLAKPRDEPRHLFGQAGKARPAVIVPLIHIERAVDFDLQRMPALAGPAVMAGGEAAGIGSVERHDKAA